MRQDFFAKYLAAIIYNSNYLIFIYDLTQVIF